MTDNHISLHTSDVKTAFLPTLSKALELVLVELILTLALGEAIRTHLHRVHETHAMQREVTATVATVDLPTPPAVVLHQQSIPHGKHWRATHPLTEQQSTKQCPKLAENHFPLH